MEELRRKKRKGFTLIELIAVIAIIGILAAVLVPKVVGYLNDSKRSKVVAQCRTFVMAVETYNGKEVDSLDNPDVDALTTAVASPASGIDYSEYFDLTTLDSIATDIDYDTAKKATDGKAIVDISAGLPWAGGFVGDAS